MKLFFIRMRIVEGKELCLSSYEDFGNVLYELNKNGRIKWEELYVFVFIILFLFSFLLGVFF